MPVDRPYSPSEGIWLKDDFVTNDLVTDNNLGELQLQLTAVAGGSTLTLPTALTGVLRSTTANGGGDGVSIHSLPDGLVLNGRPGGLAFRVRYPGIAGNVLALNNFRIGLGDSVTATAEAVGITMQSLAGVLTLRSDSTNGDNAVAVSGVSTLTSGTTMVLDTWHEFLITWTGTNGNGGPRYIEAFVDGEEAATTYSVIGSTETMELKMTHWTTAADTLDLDIDYFEFWQYGSDTAGER